MTNDNARKLSPEANNLDIKALVLLAQVQGYFDAMQGAGVVYAPSVLAELRADIQAYVYGK